MNEGNLLAHAGVTRRMPIGRLVDDHIAIVGCMDSAENLDERTLAGPVLAKQGDDFAATDVHGHALERMRAAERFTDSVEEQAVGQPGWRRDGSARGIVGTL